MPCLEFYMFCACKGGFPMGFFPHPKNMPIDSLAMLICLKMIHEWLDSLMASSGWLEYNFSWIFFHLHISQNLFLQ